MLAKGAVTTKKGGFKRAGEPRKSTREFGEYREGLGDEQEKEIGWFASNIESKMIL
jgi:hypothetical protein